MDRSKREARMQRRRSEARRGQVKWIGYIAIAAVIITVLLILSNQVRQPETRDYSQKSGVTLGDPSAPVTLVVFADFQCPHCLNAYSQTEGLIIDEYVSTGEIKLTYAPVGFLGPESEQSAEAAYCAADQNFFWEYHGIVFTNFSNGNSGRYSDDRLVDFAASIDGMDVDEFSECLLNDTKASMVAEAEATAANIGVTGTPAYVINGQVLSGEQPYPALQQLIESALAASGN
jgi:protein-disulfide isomerase